jgi:hypothetical protein
MPKPQDTRGPSEYPSRAQATGCLPIRPVRRSCCCRWRSDQRVAGPSVRSSRRRRGWGFSATRGRSSQPERRSGTGDAGAKHRPQPARRTRRMSRDQDHAGQPRSLWLMRQTGAIACWHHRRPCLGRRRLGTLLSGSTGAAPFSAPRGRGRQTARLGTERRCVGQTRAGRAGQPVATADTAHGVSALRGADRSTPSARLRRPNSRGRVPKKWSWYASTMSTRCRILWYWIVPWQRRSPAYPRTARPLPRKRSPWTSLASREARKKHGARSASIESSPSRDRFRFRLSTYQEEA